MPLPVYARKTKKGVEIFRDAEATRPFCHFTRDNGKMPDRRNKYITLNCCRWKLVWLYD